MGAATSEGRVAPESGKSLTSVRIWKSQCGLTVVNRSVVEMR